MGTGDGESKAEVAVAASKDVKDVKEEKETAVDTGEGDANKQAEDTKTKMPPPAAAAAAAPGGAGNAGAGGARGAAGKNSGSAAIQAAVKAGNINIHQEERESCAPSLLACSFGLPLARTLYVRVYS